MKYSFSKFITLTLILSLSSLFYTSLHAQTIPGGVNFQAIARNASGAVLANTAVQVRVSILDGTAGGTVLGSYTYQKTTDAYGQFTVAIGTDATIANSGAALSAINWTAASRFIKVEYQPGTSGGFTLVSNTEATASFYSFAAKTAAGLSIVGSNGDVLKYNGSNWVATSFLAPTVTTLTSGSGTYTTPANVKYIKVRMVGGGGGGSGSVGIGGTSTGGNGGNTLWQTFGGGTTILQANGGAGGQSTINGGAGGDGGSVTVNAPAIAIVSVAGAPGNAFGQATINVTPVWNSPSGGASVFGGAGGGGGIGIVGRNAKTNTGSGGAGGGGSFTTNCNSGSGGGAGGYIEAFIQSPALSYTFLIGTGGTGGTAIGSGSTNGGSGGSGIIIIEEYYQ